VAATATLVVDRLPLIAIMRRRVVVTGIGAITPIGITGRQLWDGVRAERSAVRSLTRFDPSVFRSHNAAEVNEFVPTDHLEAKRAKRLDRFGQFSVVAARLASDAAIMPSMLPPVEWSMNG